MITPQPAFSLSRKGVINIASNLCLKSSNRTKILLFMAASATVWYCPKKIPGFTRPIPEGSVERNICFAFTESRAFIAEQLGFKHTSNVTKEITHLSDMGYIHKTNAIQLKSLIFDLIHEDFFSEFAL